MKQYKSIIASALIILFGFAFYSSAKISNPSSFSTTGFLQATNNLSDVSSSSTARTNLGLGDSATLASSTWAKIANNLSDLSSSTVARTNLGLGSLSVFNSIIAGNGVNVTTGTSTVTIESKEKFQYFVMESPTSTEDIYVFTPRTTTTISQVYAVNKTASDTVTWNLVWDNSRATATSSVASKLFATATTTTATTTMASYTSFASTTINAGQAVRFITTSASSTQFGLTLHYNEQ